LPFLEAEKRAGAPSSPTQTSKDGEELDQVAGNAEDEIGERIAGVRETELFYGPESLLAVYGPMIVHICGSPHKFKVGEFNVSRHLLNHHTESDFARRCYTVF
jgi:hypothetical protein